MLEVKLVDAEEHSSHISEQDVHQFIEFEWNLLRRLHFLPVLLTDTRFALVLTQEHSVGQRQHVMVDERFQTQTWRFVSVLGGCNFDQGLQEVLKVHVGFVAVNRAENQVRCIYWGTARVHWFCIYPSWVSQTRKVSSMYPIQG